MTLSELLSLGMQYGHPYQEQDGKWYRTLNINPLAVPSDEELFGKGNGTDDLDNTASWYRQICEITMNGKCWGVKDGKSAVSESGMGDGSYPCYVALDKNKEVVAISIEYIDEY